MKIVLAIDSFKGCLTSHEVESAVSDALRKYIPDCIIETVPIADGGEGTLNILSGIMDAQYQHCMAHNPCMEIIPCQYALSSARSCALIEMAAVSGLPLIRTEQQNPMKTTTYGTGELIVDALNQGCTHFIVGLGGSATNDAGVGMLQALGYRFYDADNNLLGQGGEILNRIVSWDASMCHPLLEKARFTVACDVNNPFYGENGAACVYAGQKGATEEMIIQLDKGLFSFARVIYKNTGIDISHIPGSGAAGGMGGGMLAFLNTELKSGSSLILELSNFEEKLLNADLIITGEGCIDSQTLMGKIPGEILRIGKGKHIPVVGLAGRVKDKDTLLKAGFRDVYAITPKNMTLAKALKKDSAVSNIHNTIADLYNDIQAMLIQ